MIGDILPTLARLLFLGRLKGIHLFSRHCTSSCLVLWSLKSSIVTTLSPTLVDLPPVCLSLPGMRLSYLQVAILLATGLQHRDVDAISTELDLPVNQVLAFFNKV